MTQASTAAPAARAEKKSPAELTGATVLARSLKEQGVEHIFGIVGFPVYDIPRAARKAGIRYLGFRNEQAASYAAGAVGYLTGRPGACLAVSGPGMIHAIAGLANAQANCWPMLLLGGASYGYQSGQGGFQEMDQVEAARPFSKYAARPDSIERLPFFVEQAVRTSIYGRPGAAYLDLPAEFISGKTEPSRVEFKERCAEPPRPLAEPAEVRRALDLLRSAERPLVIVGKGAAYSRAEHEVREFIERTGLPFLPTPMGKGVISDDSPLSVAPARSYALGHADVVLLMGARLNWILHFGLPPRFAAGVKTIQIDIAAEEIGANVPAAAALAGDVKSVVTQLNEALEAEPWSLDREGEWSGTLRADAERNRAASAAMMNDDSAPMGYYRVLREVRDRMPRDAILVSEGANTMDIGRTVLPCFEPRRRLDAGSFGTMGVGLGFAIAAAVVHPEKKVIAVEGDSAFGFSGMEVEVACRHRLPITFVIINNNGIGGGVSEIDYDRGVPPSVYTIGARYERVIEAFGGKGYFVTKPEELGPALVEALADPMPNIVNVMIDPKAQRKPQKFAWLTAR